MVVGAVASGCHKQPMIGVRHKKSAAVRFAKANPHHRLGDVALRIRIVARGVLEKISLDQIRRPRASVKRIRKGSAGADEARNHQDGMNNPVHLCDIPLPQSVAYDAESSLNESKREQNQGRFCRKKPRAEAPLVTPVPKTTNCHGQGSK